MNEAINGASRILERQQQAHVLAPYPSRADREERLDRLLSLIADYAEAFCDAVNEDFGGRSADNTYALDLMPAADATRHARSLISALMKPERRKSQFPLGLLGGKSHIQQVPLGVVGVVAPWNFPVALALGPLAEILAAGNRCMIKPSELTPATASLLREAIGKWFSEDEVAVVEGGPEVAASFTQLLFDHLLFTGSTHIARHVLSAAAPNLVPVTLELGGKSPVIISESADLEQAALKILYGKTLNAGQICLAPDYVLIPEQLEEPFLAHLKQAAKNLFPGFVDNEDYTAIISSRHFDRLTELVDEAEQAGARLVPLADEAGAGGKFPPVAVRNPSLSSRLMQEEIFGPILPVLTCSGLDQAIAQIGAGPHPLAIYYFGNDRREIEEVTLKTRCGGICVNDVIMHYAQYELPFGGVGDSGSGYYHGLEGLKTFSHAKAVFQQSRFDVMKLFRPPYGNTFRKLVRGRVH